MVSRTRTSTQSLGNLLGSGAGASGRRSAPLDHEEKELGIIPPEYTVSRNRRNKDGVKINKINIMDWPLRPDTPTNIPNSEDGIGPMRELNKSYFDTSAKYEDKRISIAGSVLESIRSIGGRDLHTTASQDRLV